MGFRINTNVAALTAHNAAVQNNNALNSSLQKLSSGLRINTAADDASGLAIADSLRSQASSLGQAVSNGNDAVGLLQTADGALSEYGNILDTIQTKATQAASDTQSTASRQSIQNDINALLKELNNISSTTSFNGQSLLTGTYNNKQFQMGSSANQAVSVSIGSVETSKIGQTTTANMDITKLGANQLTLTNGTTGDKIALAPIDLEANNNAANGLGAVASQINQYSTATGISATAVVQSSTGAITAGTTGSDFAINGVTIGAVQVSANDSTGTLLNAINAQSTQTGVTATSNQDGSLSLATADGRAISVTGDASSVIANSDAQMSTFGHLQVTQAGSSSFQISGLAGAAAVGGDITTSGATQTIADSVLAAKSVIKAQSVLGAGTEIGGSGSFTNKTFTNVSATTDSYIAANSLIKSGTTLGKGTTLTDATRFAAITVTSDMLVKAGSILKTGTIFDAGTVLGQDITNGSTTYKAGTVLNTDLTLSNSVTLNADMTIHYDSVNGNSKIAAGSTLAAGTTLGANAKTSGDVTLTATLDVKAGTILKTSSTFKAGTIFGEQVTISTNMTTTQSSALTAGSTIATGSTIKKDSTLGGNTTLAAAVTLKENVAVKAGSVLATGTILKAGTVLMQDLTATQDSVGGLGAGLKAGTTLGTDVTLQAKVNVSSDFTMLSGADNTGKIGSGSVLAANSDNGADSVKISNQNYSSLNSIDVTTMDGAMKAISIAGNAITNLDAIRSSIGSAQNQITSTINNISTTQVNVTAAESNIRDVDFAQESANFSKYNILSQSGSYAMSQANSVQQNVLRLLQ